MLVCFDANGRCSKCYVYCCHVSIWVSETLLIYSFRLVYTIGVSDGGVIIYKANYRLYLEYTG